MADEPTVELALQTVAGPISGRLNLPLRVQVDGIDAVIVSADAYDALVQAAGKSVGVRSRIERDPEVQRFVDQRLATHELAVLRDAVSKHFGWDRTPSQSGLHRYAMARRQAAAAFIRAATGSRDS